MLTPQGHLVLADDAEAPFAFLAAYTTRLSAHGKAQHQPLAAALAEFSGSRRKAQLLSLLCRYSGRRSAQSRLTSELELVGCTRHQPGNRNLI